MPLLTAPYFLVDIKTELANFKFRAISLPEGLTGHQSRSGFVLIFHLLLVQNQSQEEVSYKRLVFSPQFQPE